LKSPLPEDFQKAVAAYLETTRGWAAAEYRLEAHSDEHAVTVVYLKDEAASQPGGGQSVILRIDKRSGRVVGETAFQ